MKAQSQERHENTTQKKEGIKSMKKWYNVEIRKDEFEILRFYLKAKEIKYRPSECYNFVHVEMELYEEQTTEVNAFLDAIENLENSERWQAAEILREEWGVDNGKNL